MYPSFLFHLGIDKDNVGDVVGYGGKEVAVMEQMLPPRLLHLSLGLLLVCAVAHRGGCTLAAGPPGFRRSEAVPDGISL